MFYDRFEWLCKKHGKSPFGFCKEIGLSGGVAAYWKKSGKPPKRETLEKIAQEFNVTVDFLLGREKIIAPVVADRSELSDILMQLTVEELIEVRDFARYLLSKRQSPEPPTNL